MKKRLFCIALVLTVLFSACEATMTKKIENPFVFYYINDVGASKNGTLSTVTQSLKVEEMTAEEIVREYLSSTAPEGTRNAISALWRLKSVSEENGVVSVSFSGPKATTVQNHLAAACLTKMLTQLSDVEKVCVYVPGVREPISLTQGDILLEDTAMKPQEESIVLYLPDQNERYLVKQVQTVEAMDMMEKAKYILQELLQDTQLLEVTVENGLCKINLSSEFVTNMEKSFSAERLAVYSIVNSLTELPEITTVDIWIEGTPLDMLNFMKLPAGLERNESLLATYASTATDLDLYLTCDGKSLIRVPYPAANPSNADLYSLLVNALIDFEPSHGVRNCIPQGTKLLNLRMEDTACIVDLSGEFLSECKSDEEEIMAVYSIVATLCAANRIYTVEILVEGLEPAYRNAWLKNVRQTNGAWLAEE